MASCRRLFPCLRVHRMDRRIPHRTVWLRRARTRCAIARGHLRRWWRSGVPAVAEIAPWAMPCVGLRLRLIRPTTTPAFTVAHLHRKNHRHRTRDKEKMMEDKEKLELEVRRILASEVEGYRSHLQSQFRTLTWGVGILFTIGAILLYFFLGDKLDESKAQLVRTVDSKMIDYRIVDSFKNRLEEVIQITLRNEDTRNIIDAKIDESAKAAIDRKIDEVRQMVTTELPNEIIERAAMPRGAVLAFNGQSCPAGWNEYIPAYGRFIRGIDKSNSGTDPDGMRKPGSHQNEQFGSHSHTRPRGVYDAGGGSDSAWVAHSRHFAYGHDSPPNTGNTGGSETRPDNVALLYCEKT